MGVLPLRLPLIFISLACLHALVTHLPLPLLFQCLNVTQLLWNFGLGQASHITPSHFTFLCPALLYQIDSGVCLQHTEEDVVEEQSGMLFLIGRYTWTNMIDPLCLNTFLDSLFWP